VNLEIYSTSGRSTEISPTHFQVPHHYQNPPIPVPISVLTPVHICISNSIPIRIFAAGEIVFLLNFINNIDLQNIWYMHILSDVSFIFSRLQFEY
jgi:hypothetical protein